MISRRFAGALALGAACVTAQQAAHAQSYPTRPVRIVVPLAAGGGMDTVTRALAIKLTEAFNHSFVVDNRPGAGSQIALDILRNAAPDGYTLMMISATTVVHPILYKSRFDIVRDFEPISQVTAQGYALVVHPSIPVKTTAEFIKYLRANPGKLNYASSGIGSLIHMSGELFQISTGTRMAHVPFKGMGAAYTDLVGGRVEVSFPTIISSLPHVSSGKLRALAVTTAKRVRAIPDVPTMAEAGVKGVVVENWYGLIAPPKTPRPIIDRVAAETAKAMDAPDVVKRLAADGSEPVGGTPAEFAKHIRSEHALWSRVIKQAGIQGE